jgi:hypothetical protein
MRYAHLPRGPRVRTLLSLLVATMFVAVHPATLSARDSVGVVVRIYNQAGESIAQLNRAQRIAAVLFRTAGLDVGWRLCRAAAGPSAALTDRCDDPLGPTELIVRVTRESINDDATVLGYSAIDTREGVGGVLATVLAHRVNAQADRDGIQREHLLGLTIAHEVGHLLMGTAAHSTQGLMKEQWAANDVQRAPLARWTFSRAEARAIVASLAVRARSVPLPAPLAVRVAVDGVSGAGAAMRLVR